MNFLILCSTIITLMLASCTSDPKIFSIYFPEKDTDRYAELKNINNININEKIKDTRPNDSIQKKQKEINDSLKLIKRLDSIKKINNLTILKKLDSIIRIDSLKILKRLDSIKIIDSLKILKKLDSIRTIDSLKSKHILDSLQNDTIASKGYFKTLNRFYSLYNPPKGYLIGYPNFLYQSSETDEILDIPLVKIIPKNGSYPFDVRVTVYADREKNYPKYILRGNQISNDKYINWNKEIDLEEKRTIENNSITLPTKKDGLFYYNFRTKYDTINVKTEILNIPKYFLQ